MNRVYVNLKNIVYLREGARVTLRDVCTLHAASQPTQPLYDAVLLPRLQRRQSVDALRVLELLERHAKPDSDLCMLGASACSLRIRPAKKPFTLGGLLKGAAIALLLFFGGGMAIINYHTDAGMAQAHTTVSESVGGGEAGAVWMSVAYSVGVAGGILLFAGLGNKQKPNMLQLETMEYTQKMEDFRDMTGSE